MPRYNIHDEIGFFLLSLSVFLIFSLKIYFILFYLGVKLQGHRVDTKGWRNEWGGDVQCERQKNKKTRKQTNKKTKTKKYCQVSIVSFSHK